MFTIMKYTIIALLMITLTACGGSGGTPGTKPKLGTSPKNTGVWIGEINSTLFSLVIAENGASFATDIDTVLWTGTATTTGNAISIDSKRYTNDINNGNNDTLTADAGASTLNLTTPIGSGEFTYQSLYENNSTLSQTSGIWSITGTVPLGNWTISVNNDGSFSGQFANSCMANGQLEIINSDYNPMTLAITMTLCGAMDGDYSGLAILTSETPGTDNSLSFSFSDGVDNGFYFDDIRKQ